MKGWRKPAEPVRRQRVLSEDLGPKPSPFAYRSSRRQSQNTGRQTAKEQGPATARPANFWIQRFGLIVLLIALTVSAVNTLSLSSKAKVMPMISGQNEAFLRDEAVYEKAASEILADSVWNRNKITVDTGSVSRELKQRFPELADVSVTIPLLAHRPLVYIEPAKPALVLAARNGSFVVAESGKALLQADSPEAFNQLGLPLLSDQGSLRVELNRQAVPADDVKFVQTIVTQLDAKQLKVESMTLPSGTRELDVKLVGEGYVIKFNLMAPDKAREQAGTFLAMYEQLKSQNIKPAQYVDVRLAGRAYYQ